MSRILIAFVLFGLIVAAFSGLAPRGVWSEDSLGYNLYQLVTGNFHSPMIVSTSVITFLLAAMLYFAAGGTQMFMAEMGVKNFLMVSVVFPLGAMLLANAICLVIFPLLRR